MQRGEERVKEQLKQRARMLVDQIKEEEVPFVEGAAAKFSKKPMDVKEDARVVDRAAKAAKTLARQKPEKKPLEVSFDVKEDLKGLKPAQAKVVSIAKEDAALRSLFISA